MDRRAAAPQSAERIHREHSLAEPAAVTVPIPPTGRAAPTSLGLPSTSVAPARGRHQFRTSRLAANSPRHQRPPALRRQGATTTPHTAYLPRGGRASQSPEVGPSQLPPLGYLVPSLTNPKSGSTSGASISVPRATDSVSSSTE